MAPLGENRGVITTAEIKEAIFDPAFGPQNTLEVVIQPAYKVQDAETLPVKVSFTPIVNGLSALSGLIERLGLDPGFDSGGFDEKTLLGREVAFTLSQNRNGFPVVIKESIVPA